MQTADFDYDLPAGLIAAHPAAERDASRLMIVDRSKSGFEHRRFGELPEYLRAGDCLVLNDSRVIPARLIGRRAKGGKAEIFLLHPEPDDRWRALVKPGRKLPAGSSVIIGDEDDPGGVPVRIEDVLSEGERIVRIDRAGDINSFLERYGRIPLPPYIVSARRGETRRNRATGEDDVSFEDEEGRDHEEREDRERYQTAYARWAGSVAAPTAGLHFTEGLLEHIEKMGVEIRRVTLHVGPGTFAPVKEKDPRQHPMHRERFSISKEDAIGIQAAITDSARLVIAVGTTVVRTLESCMRQHGKIAPGDFSTELLILPGDEFHSIDAMITNFHLPRSTLLMLVCAFAGREKILEAYEEAIREKYRFYSYGDAMLIL